MLLCRPRRSFYRHPPTCVLSALLSVVGRRRHERITTNDIRQQTQSHRHESVTSATLPGQLLHTGTLSSDEEQARALVSLAAAWLVRLWAPLFHCEWVTLPRLFISAEFSPMATILHKSSEGHVDQG